MKKNRNNLVYFFFLLSHVFIILITKLIKYLDGYRLTDLEIKMLQVLDNISISISSLIFEIEEIDIPLELTSYILYKYMHTDIYRYFQKYR